eukprot:6649763-Lingulodinium_polyedra.AAC.1
MGTTGRQRPRATDRRTDNAGDCAAKLGLRSGGALNNTSTPRASRGAPPPRQTLARQPRLGR